MLPAIATKSFLLPFGMAHLPLTSASAIRSFGLRTW
jgi:hypothetical protein